MGPELISGRSGYDGKKVDVWASGVLLFVLLLGMFPFEMEDENYVNTAGARRAAGGPHAAWPRQAGRESLPGAVLLPARLGCRSRHSCQGCATGNKVLTQRAPTDRPLQHLDPADPHQLAGEPAQRARRVAAVARVQVRPPPTCALAAASAVAQRRTVTPSPQPLTRRPPAHPSPPPRDLLDRMFDVNQDSRISIEQIVKHPWFSRQLPPR
jgi:serine/threonine protein kinase